MPVTIYLRNSISKKKKNKAIDFCNIFTKAQKNNSQKIFEKQSANFISPTTRQKKKNSKNIQNVKQNRTASL